MAQKEKHICKNIHVRECVDFDASQLLGAPFPVTLTGGVLEKICQDCGAKAGHVLKNPRQLIGMVAVLRSCDPKKLNGGEVKFLRKSMGLKAKQLAAKLDMDASHLSKIENDRHPISTVCEKLLRSAVCFHYLEETNRLNMDGSEIISMDILSAVCATRTFALEMCLVEVENTLSVVGGKISKNHPSTSSWKDDGGTKVAV